MNVGILGAGRVGGTLGRALARAGHGVVYGVREPDAPGHAGLREDGARVAGVAAAVAASDVVILATPWAAVRDALNAAGDFGGRPLLDATNPLGPDLELTHGHTDSGAEQVQRWAPSAKVAKVFHSTGAEIMADPRFGSNRAVMLFCGDDPRACEAARTLAEDVGFEAVAAGPLASARMLEPFARLWIDLALRRGLGRAFAFGLLRR